MNNILEITSNKMVLISFEEYDKLKKNNDSTDYWKRCFDELKADRLEAFRKQEEQKQKIQYTFYLEEVQKEMKKVPKWIRKLFKCSL